MQMDDLVKWSGYGLAAGSFVAGLIWSVRKLIKKSARKKEIPKINESPDEKDAQKITSLLPFIQLMIERITKALADQALQNLSGSQLANVLSRTVHSFGQSIFERYREGTDVVVSYKIVDHSLSPPENLVCQYLEERLPAHRASNPCKRTPIRGTASGQAFTLKRPIFVPNVNEQRDLFTDEMHAHVSPIIGSLIAWPISVEGEIIGVLNVESRVSGTFVENPPTKQLVHAVAAVFELAFQIGRRLDRPSDLKPNPDVLKT
jgi:hypothetical protein